MKKISCIMIIVLSLFGCNKSDHNQSIHVNIEASGQIQMVPDMASIAVNISCTDKALSKSTECTKMSIDRLFALLNKHHIKKEDYHSSRVNLEKKYTWKNNSQVFSGYKSSSTINILLKDLEVMSIVITEIMTMENASLYNLNYSHSKIDSLANKAYLKALENSTVLANAFKHKLGAKSVEVIQTSNIRENFNNSNPMILSENKKTFSARSNDSAPIQVNPGALKIIKNIYVQYRVTF